MADMNMGRNAASAAGNVKHRNKGGRILSPFRNLVSGRLSVRLPVMIVGMLILTAAAVGGAGYFVAYDSIREIELHKLESVAASRSEEIDHKLEAISNDLRFMSKDLTVVDAIRSFSTAYAEMADPAKIRQDYITENPFPLGEKHKLDAAPGKSTYDMFHAYYHPVMRELMEARGYYDVFLFNDQGDLIYSVFKEDDFATNFQNGRWRDTGLGRVYREAMALGTQGGHVFDDFAKYAPSHGAPASFLATPVLVEGQVAGVLAIQMPLGEITHIVERDADIGSHGELLLLSKDGLMLTDSPNTAENDLLATRYESPVLAGLREVVPASGEYVPDNTVYGQYTAKSGEDWFIGAVAMPVFGSNWTIVARAYESEMMAPARDMRDLFLMIGLGSVALFLALSVWSIRGITNRMRRMVGEVSQLANGETGVEMTGNTKDDELGDIARALGQIDQNNIGTLRIKSALDNAATNVMVADIDLNVVYANSTLDKMLKTAEADIRTELPQFSAEKVVGTNIDMFHKKPEHQRGMLARLSETFRTGIAVGGRNFNLIVNPIFDPAGEKVGFVVEWNDVTQELAVEAEIDNLVRAAVDGDFSQRLSLEGKAGFQLTLSEAMNRLCATTSDAINSVADALSGLSEGDLTRRVNGEFSGLFGKLQSDTNTTSEQLSRIVMDIMSAADEVSAAADEISSGTSDLSSRTEQQASNLEETAASMEQMASTIKQNAENAQQANQLSTSARDVAMRGGSIVENAISAMSRIEESSQKVSDIIGVIDEIAFQTNLLALNAAVEAARAGDAGKGFAVVASEVRTLAQRSSQAAKDIKGLIVDSGAQVKDGVELVNNTGKSLGEIVDSIKRLSDIVSEISAASNEQATGVEEINRAVSQMDEMTQQNAALVEESAASAKTLLEQSRGMRQRMTFFNVSDSEQSVATLGEKAKAEFQARVDPTRTKRAASSVRKVAGAGGGGFVAVDGDEDGWQDF